MYLKSYHGFNKKKKERKSARKLDLNGEERPVALLGAKGKSPATMTATVDVLTSGKRVA